MIHRYAVAELCICTLICWDVHVVLLTNKKMETMCIVKYISICNIYEHVLWMFRNYNQPGYYNICHQGMVTGILANSDVRGRCNFSLFLFSNYFLGS